MDCILQILLVSLLSIGTGSASDRFDDVVNSEYYQTVLNEIKAENIKEQLRFLTEYPHHPGSKRNTMLGEYIADQWRASGFDKTEIFRYNILLSYPEAPGEISLNHRGNLVRKLVIGNEPVIDKTESKGTPLYPFNAFSPSGTVTGEYVYANYGRKVDFDTLTKLGISIVGKIVVVRYGKGYRGGKVLRAETGGAVGVIIFSDPYDYTYAGKAYPDGWMLNKDGVQRGTINRLAGDALSIGYPAKLNYFRKGKSKYTGNPQIPSQPISYGTAYHILSHMKDNSIPLPEGFQGGLNFTYTLSSGADRTLTLKVSTKTESRESITVCSTLFGNTQPDRYVVIGNHRDSWTYGGSDPSSGTAAMIELVRSFGKAKKEKGWRPRKSIMACSWGAEETGVQGSTEWADENHRFISEKVIGYLNVDMSVEGNFTIRLKALKHIENGLYQVSKTIPAPDDKGVTLYDDWLDKSKILKDNNELTKPFFITPVAGSDYKAFWHTYGTTIADLRYLFSKKDYPKLSPNGHYHTRYESFGWMSKYVDPKFAYHLTIAKLWAGYTIMLTDSKIIPYNLVTYTKQVKYFFDKFEDAYESILSKQGISLSFMRKRLKALISKCEQFHALITTLSSKNLSPYKLASINDKLMNFERNFLINGISSKLSTRHVIYASSGPTLTRSKFPGISEAIFKATKSGKGDWDEVRKQITLVVWCFDTANRSIDLDELKQR